MALLKRYKPKLTEWEKEKRRRAFITGIYLTVSACMLCYFLLQEGVSTYQIVRFTFPFMDTNDDLNIAFYKMLLEGSGAGK